jgi:hypothetical protein
MLKYLSKIIKAYLKLLLPFCQKKLIHGEISTEFIATRSIVMKMDAFCCI